MNNIPLYEDLLDYLERDGIASLSNDFDPNAFMTNYDELDTTSPLINNPTVDPTIPYIIPPLGGGDGGDGPRQGLESLNIDPIDKIIDYTNFNHPTMNEIANDDDEYLFDAENFDEFYDPMNRMGMSAFSRPDQVKNAVTQAAYDEAQRVAAFERQQREAEQAAKDRAEKARQKELQKRQEAAEKSRQGYDPKNIGGGNYRSDRDHDGDGGYGNTGGDGYGDKSGQRSEDNRSSDLGFSDIRLKENVELIGKSPSNINIYKFNYKDNPTTYQGTMAHEVPWASVKHSNGYMMVDYNQIDVEFKKI